MSGNRPDDVLFHLKFQAEIFDQVAQIAATPAGQETARKQAANLRMRAGAVIQGSGFDRGLPPVGQFGIEARQQSAAAG